MKKILSMLLALLMVISILPVMAEDSGGFTGFQLNGVEQTLIAYNINDNNYFKLRDIANLFKGTEAQFDVSWNAAQGAVEITPGEPYSTEEEITDTLLENPVAKQSYPTIYKNGERILLKAYEIGGNNFFKLRDLAAALDFSVTWTAENGIMVDTDKPYTFPEVSDFSVNLETMSLIGKSKAQIDAKYGAGSYWAEFGVVDYNNGIMVGYDTLGGTPVDDDIASVLWVTMEQMFYHCPDVLSAELIASAFDHSFLDYDEMEEENILCVNYCGRSICFDIDGTIGKDDMVLINVNNPYMGDTTSERAIMTEKPAELEYATRDFVGYYTDDETQSYFTFSLYSEGWTIDLYLVRNFAGKYVCKLIDDYTMEFSNEFGDFELTWSKDYKSVVLTDLEYGTEWYFNE